MAVDSKFFNIPFGATGDRATIPEATQPSGAVSYQQGFGPDYERDPATDPLAKRVPRDGTNEYLYQISNAVKYLQWYGVPQYTSVADGGPANYPLTARVRYDAGAGMQVWASIVATNTAVPGSDPAKWVVDDAFSEASLAEALAATLGTKVISPRRLGASVQQNPWTYAVAAGTANALTIAPVPAVTANVAGSIFRVQITAVNTGAATLKVGSAAAANIKTFSGANIAAGDLPVGAILEFVFDGTSWLLLGLVKSEVVTPIVATPTFYIRTDGNDNNNGSANTAGAAFLTIAGALSYVKNRYGLPGRPIIFQLGIAGTYAGTQISGVPGGLTIIGDVANRGNYIIQATAGTTVSGGSVTFQGLSFSIPSSPTQPALQVGNGGFATIDRVTFTGVSQSAVAHLFAAAGGTIVFAGGSTAATFNSDARAAMYAEGGGNISFSTGTVVSMGGTNPTFTLGTVAANSCGSVLLGVGSFTNTAIGPRYNAVLNGVINVGGGGASFIPGTVAGSTATGGQYA